MEFRIELATAADDAAIRRLLRENPVPGAITLSFEREPDYFLGCGPMGRFVQVLVARHVPTGEVAGISCRATRPMYVNGWPAEVGYLGELRVDPRFRGRLLVARGVQFLRELHADGRAEAYLATITEGNREALGILVEKPRRHFPSMRPVDRLHTLALLVRRSAAVECESASLPEVLAFLNRVGRDRQFFPVYSEADFAFPGFRMKDVFVVRQAGQIVGCMALWDQSSFKQSVVRGYSGMLGWGRGMYNFGARLAGFQPLPAPGQALRNAYGTFICVERNDPAVFRQLLAGVYARAGERGFGYLTLGLFESDPLLAEARRYPHIPYYSKLYTMSWEAGGDFHERLDDRIPYLDIAAM
ncbi:MAG TPA: hypothetical protein VNT75_03700 [Symbiobacteriaceae bacterium]|nr:hypothetical protein [Symbiobacteriaceae bacterium]